MGYQAFIGFPEVATWADLVALASPVVGRVYTVLQPVIAGGAYGTRWVWDGTFWRPACHQVLWHLPAQIDGVAGGTTAEQTLVSLLFPAGLTRGLRGLQLESRWSASGTETNGRQIRWRLGTTGTVSDTNLTVSATMTSTQRGYINPMKVVPTSNTTVRAVGGAFTTAVATDVASGQGAPSGDQTVGDLTGPIYASACVLQGASPTTTISLAWAAVYVE